MSHYRCWSIMKLIILRDPLKLDFYESLLGAHAPPPIKIQEGMCFKKKREMSQTPFQHLSLMYEAHINRMLGC